jgi:hypothetical protein
MNEMKEILYTASYRYQTAHLSSDSPQRSLLPQSIACSAIGGAPCFGPTQRMLSAAPEGGRSRDQITHVHSRATHLFEFTILWP